MNYNNIEFYDKEAFLPGLITRFESSLEELLTKQIEVSVLEWLKDDTRDSVLQLSFEPSGMMLFSRSEIRIKNCYNGWEVWRIATSSSYPKMISLKIKEIGTNNFIDDNFRLPNEVRSQCYSEETNNNWSF